MFPLRDENPTELTPIVTMFGLDFAFTAVFLALIAGMWNGKSDILPWTVAAAVAVAVAQNQRRVKQHVEEHRIAYPVLWDARGAAVRLNGGH